MLCAGPALQNLGAAWSLQPQQEALLSKIIIKIKNTGLGVTGAYRLCPSQVLPLALDSCCCFSPLTPGYLIVAKLQTCSKIWIMMIF